MVDPQQAPGERNEISQSNVKNFAVVDPSDRYTVLGPRNLLVGFERFHYHASSTP